MNFSNQENDQNLAISRITGFSIFYPILDYYEIRTRTNFENPNGESLDLHLIM